MVDDVSLKGRKRDGEDVGMDMDVGGDVDAGTCRQALDRHRQT